MEKQITLRGIRTRNLKNIDASVPLGKITALVGVSGAGKSSLAFHTLYAEGYLRYIESISPYIRQFLDQIDKPDIDAIENLPPAIAFRQKKPHKNPRSIVATAADIFDYLRILYAKIADFRCPACGEPVRKYSIDEIVDELLAGPRARLRVCFPYQGDVAFLLNRGYYRHVRGDRVLDIGSTWRNRPIEVLVDEVENGAENRPRLFEAIDAAMSLSRHTLAVFSGKRRRRFPFALICPGCGQQYDSPDENLFSFNSARGACPRCKGFGDLAAIDPALVFDESLPLDSGAVRPLNTPAAGEFREHFLRQARRAGIDLQRPLRALTPGQKQFLLTGKGRFQGLEELFSYLRRKSYRVSARAFLARYTSYRPCPDCGGSRFSPLALAFGISGRSIADFLAMTIAEASAFVAALRAQDHGGRVSPDVFAEIDAKLRFLIANRLHYIQLNRPTFTLSRGEHQRINLAFILGSTLSDSLLIIDQPAADLHPADYATMARFLGRLRANGNTVVMIEHHPDLVRCADWVIELGPGSGREGGRVVFAGSSAGFFRKRPDALKAPPPRTTPARRVGRGEFIEIRNARAHNLKGFDLRIRSHALTVIVGVSGAGKSSLLYDEIYRQHAALAGPEKTVYLDPGIGTLRPNTHIAGYLGASQPLRDFFSALKPSRLLGLQPGHFSFHSPLGRCPECAGSGSLEIEMQFLPAVRRRCSLCRGSGFNPDVLKITHEGRSIADVLAMTAAEFCRAFADAIPAATTALGLLGGSGMDYLRLGERLGALSTGELQKLRLIKHLGGKPTACLFLLDEPSFGLHARDVAVVLRLIAGLLAGGNTVVAAEHNLALVAAADAVVELGPAGGDAGGRLLFAGTPGQLQRRRGSATGRHLKNFLKTT